MPAAARTVLFVCLGNICRSPMAEGAFRARAAETGLSAVADSAGTGDWHLGKAPDARAQATAARHGADISTLRARQVTADDFRRFDDIYALDLANLRDLEALRPADATARLTLLLDHVPGREGQAIADPYHGSMDDFELAWTEITTAVDALLKAS